MRNPRRLLTLAFPLACTLGTLAAPLHAQPPAGGGAPRAGRPFPMRDGPGREGDGRRVGPAGFGAPGGQRTPGAGVGANPAEFLLAHTGELQLTDQQVVRLAAIARRADARRRAQRATLDSAFSARRRAAGDTARVRPAAPPFDEAALQRMREQERVDLRDAIAVLTPDQQATAWLMRGPAMRGLGMRGPGAPAGFGGPGRGRRD